MRLIFTSLRHDYAPGCHYPGLGCNRVRSCLISSSSVAVMYPWGRGCGGSSFSRMRGGWWAPPVRRNPTQRSVLESEEPVVSRAREKKDTPLSTQLGNGA